MEAHTFQWHPVRGAYYGWIDVTRRWRSRRKKLWFNAKVYDEHGPYTWANCPWCGGELHEPTFGEGEE